MILAVSGAAEGTKGTEKIHNEGTKETKTNEEGRYFRKMTFSADTLIFATRDTPR